MTLDRWSELSSSPESHFQREDLCGISASLSPSIRAHSCLVLSSELNETEHSELQAGTCLIAIN